MPRDGPLNSDQEQPPSEGGAAEGRSGEEERSDRDSPAERGGVSSPARPPRPPSSQCQGDPPPDAGLRGAADAGDGNVRGTEGATGRLRAVSSDPPATGVHRPSVPPPSAGSGSTPEQWRKGHVQFSERLVRRTDPQIVYVHIL